MTPAPEMVSAALTDPAAELLPTDPVAGPCPTEPAEAGVPCPLEPAEVEALAPAEVAGAEVPAPLPHRATAPPVQVLVPPFGE